MVEEREFWKLGAGKEGPLVWNNGTRADVKSCAKKAMANDEAQRSKGRDIPRDRKSLKKLKA